MIDFTTKLPPTPAEDCDDAYFQQKASEMFTKAQKELLAADLSSRVVKTRKQAGMEFSYIEGWHSISEANRIFGFDGWNCETIEIKLAAEGQRPDGRAFCTYTARVRVTVYAGHRQIVREDVGAGHGLDRDIGPAHEKAAKEATTDAFKRAVRTFGNQFGLALYDKEQRGVSDDPIPIKEKESASRVSPPPMAIVTSTTLESRERAANSKRIADALIKGPLPSGYLPLEALNAALGTVGGSRTRTALNKWTKYAKGQQMTEADRARVWAVYKPLDKAIQESFKPVTEAAE